LAVVSDQAVAIGVTAVPTPITDQGSSLFFAYQVFLDRFTFASAVGITQGSKTYSVSSRAMRKVEVGQDLISVVEFSGQGSGFNFFQSGRILIKTN